MTEGTIHFPDFERDLVGHVNYNSGKFLSTQNHLSKVYKFPHGVWLVFFPSAPPPMNKFKICVQIKQSKVIDMSCTCYKQSSCKHAISALFHIREKFVDSDDENEDSEEIENSLEEEPRSSTDSFIDDTQYSQGAASSEDEEEAEIEKEKGQENGVMTMDEEFNCQVCLEQMEVPVIFPCLYHNICYTCAAKLFRNTKEGRDGNRIIQCPSCRDKHFFKMQQEDELKSRINHGLRKIIMTYKVEKELRQSTENTLKEKVKQYEEMLEQGKARNQEDFEENDMKEVKKLRDEEEEKVFEDKSERVEEKKIETNQLKEANAARKVDLIEEEIALSTPKRRQLRPLAL